MWEDIYEEIYPQLLKYAVAGCRDSQMAQDVAQEAFVRAMQEAERFLELGPNQRRAWLYRTVKNLLTDRYRRAAVEARYLSQPQQEEATEPGYEEIETQLVLAQLSQEDRLMFRMRYFEDYTAAEIGQLCHMPAGTVRSRLSRCRAMLKKQWRK